MNNMDKTGYIYCLDKPIRESKREANTNWVENEQRSCMLVNPPFLTKRAILNS